MDNYFHDITRTGASHIDLMKYEWARYESFKNFPKTSPMMPMRLAQAGFYYNGLGEEVICFCCGIRNRNWSLDETATQVHKRLVPICSFVCGEDNHNVSIHGSELDITEQKAEERETNENGLECVGINDNIKCGISGGHNDMQIRNSFAKSTPRPNERAELVISETRTNASQNITPIDRHNGLNKSVDEHTSTTRTRTAHNASNTSSPANSVHIQNEITSLSGIGFDRAKHPDYAIKSPRMSSYTGWSSHHIQTSEELAEAGFYYAGFQDCVGCFFCDGGLKNWVYGDSPWIEHARWYPKCSYLRQCKGNEYIQIYREDELGDEEIEESGILRRNSNSKTEVTTNELTHTRVASEKTHYTVNTYINSAAAESVLEMGYIRTVIQDAILIYKTYHGNTAATAEALLEIILDDNRDTAQYATTSLALSTWQQPSVPVSSSLKEGDTYQSKISLPLKADVKSIAEENRSLREQMMCKICIDKDACIVFLPCGHMVACPECAPALRKCPICRKLIKGTIKAFPS